MITAKNIILSLFISGLLIYLCFKLANVLSALKIKKLNHSQDVKDWLFKNPLYETRIKYFNNQIYKGNIFIFYSLPIMFFLSPIQYIMENPSINKFFILNLGIILAISSLMVYNLYKSNLAKHCIEKIIQTNENAARDASHP